MSKIDRRGAMKAIVAAGATVGVADLAEASLPAELRIRDMRKRSDSACLYHCDFGDHARFSQQLRNISNHLAVYNNDPRALKVVIVAHSAGIKFFLKDHADTPWAMDNIDPQLIERVKALASLGVEVYLCKVTFSTLKVDTAKARTDDFIKFVPSGIATAAALQAKGFSYLKVG